MNHEISDHRDLQSTSHLDFLDKIAPWRNVYDRMIVAYIAVRVNDDWHVAFAHVDLNVSWIRSLEEKRFESVSLRAERFLVGGPADWVTWESFLQGVANGLLKTPGGDLPVYREPFDTLTGTSWIPANDQWRRDVVYHVSTTTKSPLGDTAALEWELRSAVPPYDGVSDLADDFGINRQQLTETRIEVVAWHVIEVDVRSQVGETDAHLACLVANGGDRASVALNYRVRLNGVTCARGSLSGNALTWEQLPTMQRAVGRIEMPKGAVIQCFATIGGHAHHQYWVANPRTLPNPARAAFEQHDPGLETLREFLFDTGRRGYNARDLEFGVSWLLWLHGFSPATFGTNKRMQDAPDLLATSPNGHFLVIECTTGGLKADHKLSKLHERATSLRRRLDESGHSHLRLLPMLITSLPRAEVAADLEQAERLGILVGAREDLERAIEATLVLPNAELGFSNAERTALDNQRQHQARRKQ